MTKNRIVYVEGSSLPRFERGDGGPMTNTEAMQMVNRKEFGRIAMALDEPLKDFLRHKAMYSGQVGEIVMGVARRTMGSDRPLSDDDHEFYAFCDYLLNHVTMRIESALDEYLRDPR